MTDFKVELRHYCRNLRCRSKLRAAVANPREAFCARGCHTSFYRKRCLVCEGEMVRKTESQPVCGKRRCSNALQRTLNLGRYHASSAGVSPLKNSIKPGLETAPTGDRPWRIVAGPELTPTQLHCATVGGEEAVERINGTNLKHWRLANAKAEERCLIKRQTIPYSLHSPVH
jgi:hypothetical protein